MTAAQSKIRSLGEPIASAQEGTVSAPNSVISVSPVVLSATEAQI